MSDPQVGDARDNVTSLSISPDGKQATFGAIDGSLTIWDIDHRRCICAPITAHHSIINSVCYSADGHLIASASDDQTVGLWEATTGQSQQNPFTSHEDGILTIGFMTDSRTIVSLSRDEVVLVWKATTGKVERQFRISMDARSLATLSNDGEKLLAAHRRGIRIWNTVTMESIKAISLEGPMALCVGLSKDTAKVALGMADNSIRLWDLENDEVGWPHLEGGTELPLYVAWSPDGRTVSSVAQNATLRVWSVESRQYMSEGCHTMGPIAYSPSSSFIVFPGDDGSPDVLEVPQTPHLSSTFLLNLPTTAVFMHHAAGATETEPLCGVSGDVPTANTQHAELSGEPGRPPGRKIFSRIIGFFSPALRRLSIREEESGANAPATYENPAAVAPGTCRGMPQQSHMLPLSSDVVILFLFLSLN
ncbi:WD40-repeat-containing domain protein [Pisolithus croceorrhizus]|nr:WD40-repeat-containing domain protein [Pisolithus croceorrhizus]